MARAISEPPSPSFFFAVVSSSDEVLRIAFGPVYHEELVMRAFDAIDPDGPTFEVLRRSIRPEPTHYAAAVLRERHMLELAESDPNTFGAIVMQGVVDPIVVRGFFP